MIDSVCADEIDRLELKQRNLGLKDIRAASTADEGVNGQSSGDTPELREPVTKETVD